MRQWLQKHRRLVKWLIIVSALSWLFNFLFLGISPDDFFAKDRLATAKANWKASGITDYKLIIDVLIPLSSNPIGRISMIVRDGQVTEAEQKDLFHFNDRNYDPDKVSFEPINPQRVSDYSMDNLFDFASQYLDYAIGQVTLEFSSSSSSYIERFTEDCHSVPPLFGPAIGDCGFSYKVLEFEPLW